MIPLIKVYLNIKTYHEPKAKSHTTYHDTINTACYQSRDRCNNTVQTKWSCKSKDNRKNYCNCYINTILRFSLEHYDARCE